MNAIVPTFEIVDMPTRERCLALLEAAARTCYQSHDKIAEGTATALLQAIIDRGHESVLEHEKITVRVVLSRAILDEWTRHRLASFSVESTRYCRYATDIEFIRPWWWTLEADAKVAEKKRALWTESMESAEAFYKAALDLGFAPQDARGNLPLDLKTEMVTTANLREWRHIFKLRCASAAHPEFKRISRPLLLAFQKRIPEIFEYGMPSVNENWSTRNCWAVEIKEN